MSVRTGTHSKYLLKYSSAKHLSCISSSDIPTRQKSACTCILSLSHEFFPSRCSSDLTHQILFLRNKVAIHRKNSRKTSMLYVGLVLYEFIQLQLVRKFQQWLSKTVRISKTTAEESFQKRLLGVNAEVAESFQVGAV